MAGAFPELSFVGAFDPIANQSALAKFQAQQQLMPGEIAATQAENQLRVTEAPLKAEALTRQNALENVQYGESMIGAIAKRVAAMDPDQAPQAWDDGMRDLAAKGVAGASQYIGHYRPDLAERVGDIYGTVKPPAAPAGFDPEQAARSVASMTPDQRKSSLKNLTAAVSGYDRVRDEDTWQAEIDQLRQAGMPVDNVLTPGANWQMNYMAVRPLIDRFRASIPMLQAGVSTDTMGAPAAPPKPMYEPQSTYIGVDRDTGKPVYHDVHGGGDTTGNIPIAPKPSSAMSTFMLKQQAWLGVHPEDDAGALEFANGKRNLSPAQMQDMALNQANRELGNLTLNGTAPANPDQWVRMKAAENYQMIAGAAVLPTPPTASGSLPPQAMKALQNARGKPVKFNNGLVYKLVNGKPVKVQ